MKNIIFILIFVIIAGGGLLLFSSRFEMKNVAKRSAAPWATVTTDNRWVTYKDPEGIYTLDYPSNWHLELLESGHAGSKKDTINLSKDFGHRDDYIQIIPNERRKVTLPIKAWIDKQYSDWVESCKSGCGGGSADVYVADTTIDGFPAVKTSATAADLNLIRYYVNVKGKIYILELHSDNGGELFDEGDSETALTFQKILKSMKLYDRNDY